MPGKPEDEAIEPEVIEPADDEMESEAVQTAAADDRIASAIVKASETTGIDQLAVLEEAQLILERRFELLSSARKMAIRLTSPAHWILNKDRSGNEFGMLNRDGAALIAPILGIEIVEVRPTDAKGNWKPLRHEIDGVVSLSGSCHCRSNFTNREIFNLQAARSSSEKFIGRSDTKSATYAGEVVAETDLRSALHTLLTETKPVRALGGFSKVPRAELDLSWKGTNKTTERCVFGSGYGSGNARRTGDVTPDDVVKSRGELGDEIMRRVGGDTNDARDLLLDITKGEKPGKDGKIFPGFRDIGRLAEQWQIDKARERLIAHDVFGDAARGREPGSDDGNGGPS